MSGHATVIERLLRLCGILVVTIVAAVVGVFAIVMVVAEVVWLLGLV